jgi:hypothetical protein
MRFRVWFWDRFEPLALAVFQAFSLAKLRDLRLLFQKLKFWESYFSIKPIRFVFSYSSWGRRG